MTNNKILRKLNEEISVLNEALIAEDFTKCDEVWSKLQNIYDGYKKDCALNYNCSNFGLINYIFEDNLFDNFKTNKRIIKEYINTVKSDNNLLAQYKFIHAIKNKKNDKDLHAYINEAVNLMHESINVKTLQNSNNKLAAIIKKHNLRPHSPINEDTIKFFENCDLLAKSKKTLTNLSAINESVDTVAKYAKTIIKEDCSSIDFHELIKSFDSKFNQLSEKDKHIVESIAKATNKESINELFNKLKEECLDTIIKTQNDASLDEKTDLEFIKEQVNTKEFNADTIVEDLIKFSDIKEILLN